MYKTAVCDDEKTVCRALCEMLGEILSEKGVEFCVEEYESAEQFESARGEDPFDLMILDIEMKDKNGLELARELRAVSDSVSIVFISGHEEYMKYGYGVQPLNFLLKPVSREDLDSVVSLDLRKNHASPQIALHHANKVVHIKTESIIYIESMDHDLYIYTANERRVFRITLSEIERLLPCGMFCRCHNSYIVNFNCIDEISRTSVTLNNGTRIPIGRKFYDNFQKAFIRYMNR